jgi:hypothetical protein
MDSDKPEKPKAIHPLFRYVAYFCFIDLLILPYFPLFVVPYSLPMVLIALVALGKVRAGKFYLYSVVIASLFMMLSAMTAIGLGKAPEFLRDDFLRVFQFLTTFIYFFYFYTIAPYLNTKTVKRIMMVAVMYIVLIAIAFLVDPSFLVALRQHVYTVTAHRVGDVLIHLRFTYMFTDPNTASYFFLMLVLFILEYFKNTFMQTVLLLASTIFVAVLTQSVGGVVSLVGVAVFVSFKSFSKLKRGSLNKVLKFASVLCLLLIFTHFTFSDFTLAVFNSFDMFGGRVAANPEARRLEIWWYAVSNFIPFLWGQGYTLFSTEGSFFKPHSDHIRLIYSYGIVVYTIFIFFFFKKIFRSGYLFLVPAFMAFSVNSLIDEQKLFGLFLVLLALTYAKYQQNGSKLSMREERC